MNWNSSEIAFVVAIASVGTCFTVHWIFTRHLTTSSITNNLGRILLMRYTGLGLLGVIPAMAMIAIADWQPAEFGVNARMAGEGWVWLAALSVVFTIVSYIGAGRPAGLAMYPQVRNAEWTLGTFFHEYSSWIIYLVGYEILFRGILLFAAASVMSPWSAIALMALINSLSHIPKGPAETVVALPGSVIFGYITLTTGSIWVSVALHCVLAISTSWFSFRAHPEMRLLRR